MRVRHRIPSIFNLSMVDVMCCALGCVILLWLLNLRQAKEHEEEAAKKRDATLAELKRRTADLDRLEGEKAGLKAGLDSREARLRDLEKQLRDTEARATGLADTVAAREAQLNEARAAADKRAADLEAARAALDRRATSLAAQLGDTDRRLAAAEKRVKDFQPLADRVPQLDTQLKDAQQRLSTLQKESQAQRDRLTETGRALDEMKAARGTLELALKRQGDELTLAKAFEGKWKAAEDKRAALEKEAAAGRTSLAAAERDLGALRAEKRALEGEVVRVRQAADNRFAGITLTGRRVVFLVDMSGSMELVDEKTPAPQKWAEVRRTLLKIMQSLPDLQQFQVIVFSEEARYLLGKPNEWLDFDARTTPGRVEAALKALKPEGGTNMYAALDAAFRYRPRGLDTLYLFSDGLPNVGEGVPEAEAKRLLQAGKEPELSERLARHIRMTLKTSWNKVIREERVRINAVGFFYESPDVGAFLWALARENDGSFVGMSRP